MYKRTDMIILYTVAGLPMISKQSVDCYVENTHIELITRMIATASMAHAGHSVTHHRHNFSLSILKPVRINTMRDEN